MRATNILLFYELMKTFKFFLSSVEIMPYWTIEPTCFPIITTYGQVLKIIYTACVLIVYFIWFIIDSRHGIAAILGS
jgi:hypothetical protein